MGPLEVESDVVLWNGTVLAWNYWSAGCRHGGPIPTSCLTLGTSMYRALSSRNVGRNVVANIIVDHKRYPVGGRMVVDYAARVYIGVACVYNYSTRTSNSV